MIPLLSGIFLRRYKRFLADVRLDGQVDPVQVHCPNTGSMLTLLHEECEAYLSPSDNSQRKTRYSLEILRIPSQDTRHKNALVCVNTHRANKVAIKALEQKKIVPLADYHVLRTEPPWQNDDLKGRLDIMLEKSTGEKAFVEVKSVTMSRRGGVAEFPDAITKRGAKHLSMLRAIRACGHQSVLLFIVQRDDCYSMNIAADIDADYAQEVRKSQKEGVMILCYTCRLDTECQEQCVVLDRRLPFII